MSYLITFATLASAFIFVLGMVEPTPQLQEVAIRDK